MHGGSVIGMVAFFSTTLDKAEFFGQAGGNLRFSQSFNDSAVMSSYVYIRLDKVGISQCGLIQSWPICGSSMGVNWF